jgi:hypothetical protein
MAKSTLTTCGSCGCAIRTTDAHVRAVKVSAESTWHYHVSWIDCEAALAAEGGHYSRFGASNRIDAPYEDNLSASLPVPL